MQEMKITLTPKIAKKELIIGVQEGEHGRLLLAKVPSLKKTDRTVIAGEAISSQFSAQVENALLKYVPRSHHVYNNLLKLLGRKEA